MKKFVIAGLTAFALTASGCSDSSSNDAETGAATKSSEQMTVATSTTTEPPPAAPATPKPVDLSECTSDATFEPNTELDSAPPPREGVKVYGVQTLTDRDNRDLTSAVYYICAPGLTGNPLKDYATELATNLRTQPIADTIGAVSVWNFVGTETVARIRCSDYQIRTFNGTALKGAERGAWEEQPN